MSTAALQGIRVVDLGRILAAPFATQLLADLGADVIKVERPGVGDDSRSYGPPFLEDADADRASGFFLSCNRNKRSITVDYSKPEGAEIIRDLARTADVFVENFRVGVLGRYGLDYESLRAENPSMIYCSVTGYGQDGPYATRPGYDGVFQAMCGLMSASGYPDGQPGGGPMKVGVSVVDILTGLYAANAIQAALIHRTRTGEGQHIDIALLDCGVATLSHFAQNYLISGEVPERRGNGGFGGVPSQTFRCADRDLFLTAGTDRQFAALCAVIDRPDLASDPRFASGPDRIVNRASLLAILDAVFVLRPANAWLRALEAGGIPVSLINDLPDVFANPQVRHRALLQHASSEGGDHVALLRNPIRLSATPIEVYRAPPTLGGDLADVLGEIDRDAAKIERLRQDAVV